ncbi:hypothetical protein GW17_00034815 [Ensete ventricosum]|nr:hypothetical protein GW17_00034815 [Ensete ventricosum]
MSPEGLSYPKAKRRSEWRWTRRSATMQQRLIYRSRRKGHRCKVTDSSAMGLTAPWYRRGRTSMESLIPCSHGGRALVVKEAEEVENAKVNSKYQDKAEGLKKKVYLVEEEEVIETVVIDKSGEAEVGEVRGRGEGELNYHVVGATSGSAGEKSRKRIGLVDTDPPEVGPEAFELVINVGEVACVRRPARQQRLGAVAGGRFHDDAFSCH